MAQLSQLTDPTNYPAPPARPGKPLTYEILLIRDPNNSIIKRYDLDLIDYENRLANYLNELKISHPDHYAELNEKKQEYFRKLNQPNDSTILDSSTIDTVSFYNLFQSQFELTNGRKFNEAENNGEGRVLAYTLIMYLAGNKRFEKSTILSKISEIDINKGLLVIGGYGCGKTSIFQSVYNLLINAQNDQNLVVSDINKAIVPLRQFGLKFGYKTANGLVDEFEECTNNFDKENFWTKNTKYFSYYDDVLTERVASNYGKIDIFSELLQKRNALKTKTMISCNYADGKGLEESLKQFGTRYGGRVYDRIFEMFNVVELKGKSFRK